jgi:hypothetical protein
MKKILILILVIGSMGALATEDPPADLLAILTENDRAACMLDTEAKTLCDCSNSEHRKADSVCVVKKCCLDEVVAVGDTATTCTANVDGNYSKALQDAKSADIEVNVISY